MKCVQEPSKKEQEDVFENGPDPPHPGLDHNSCPRELQWTHRCGQECRRGKTLFCGLCLTSELYLTGAVTDWTRNSQTRERVTLGLTEIRTGDPVHMFPHQAESQFIAYQPFPVLDLVHQEPSYYNNNFAKMSRSNVTGWLTK